MRPRLFLLAIPFLLLSGCRGTQAYTSLDLAQTRQAYTEILPTYLAFKQAYKRGDDRAMHAAFEREQVECKLVDKVDARDTIDPNVNLFQASYALDLMCDAIEQVWAIWEKQHGRPYDKTQAIVPAGDVFLFSDPYVKKLHRWMRRPAALA